MTDLLKNFMSFTHIRLSEPILSKNKATAQVLLKKTNHDEQNFSLKLVYQHDLKKEHIPLLRLAFSMPLLNYSLFTQKLMLDFPLSTSDYSLLCDFNQIFSRDIFVNKIMNTKNPFIKAEYRPDEKRITPKDAEPRMIIQPQTITNDTTLIQSNELHNNRCGILSSGGKDSLLTYGLLKELGADVYPLYIAESGGHWRTALTAYKYHIATDPNTQKVWSNIDRFYSYMLDHLAFIQPHHKKIHADIYPIRLCVFPFYVFALLPLFIDNNIGNLLMGNEFDDVRYDISYKGIKHYYGIYDQHQDFDQRMNTWYTNRTKGLHQWSALLTISGLVGERILIKRYPQLAAQQRSCHSCHIKNQQILPCGHCSKCYGIMLFLLANNLDPRILLYTDEHKNSFIKNIGLCNLKLDADEKNQAFFLIGNIIHNPEIKCIDHVEKIHINPKGSDPDNIPKHYRQALFNIFEQYTTGYCILQNKEWIPTTLRQEIIH